VLTTRTVKTTVLSRGVTKLTHIKKEKLLKPFRNATRTKLCESHTSEEALSRLLYELATLLVSW
jgi:hypothetical protein